MLHEVTFESFNKRDTVYGWIYVPACKPKGIVQLIHGLGEHSRRYLHMIVAFNEAGYIVTADDHVGHGKTALENDKWSDWGDGGYKTMMEDEHKLHDLAVEKYPDLPYFMFGHSMGSMIARDYITKYGDELSGVVFCGTTGKFPNVKESIEKLESLVHDGKGDEVDLNFPAEFLGWMFARCGEVKYGNEWISHDKCVQYDHANDPFNAFTKPMNNKSWLYFIQMLDCIESIDWAKAVPVSLPIYCIAGDGDPVGMYAEGVMQCVNWLIDTGHKVDTLIYPGYRHEIHNNKETRKDVEEGIIAFFDKNI